MISKDTSGLGEPSNPSVVYPTLANGPPAQIRLALPPSDPPPQQQQQQQRAFLKKSTAPLMSFPSSSKARPAKVVVCSCYGGMNKAGRQAGRQKVCRCRGRMGRKVSNRVRMRISKPMHLFYPNTHKHTDRPTDRPTNQFCRSPLRFLAPAL